MDNNNADVQLYTHNSYPQLAFKSRTQRQSLVSIKEQPSEMRSQHRGEGKSYRGRVTTEELQRKS